MEWTPEHRRNLLRYGLPALGAAIPVAAILIRRAMSCQCEGTENKDRMLLDESNLSLQEAMNRALRFVPGTPIEVELEEEHGLPLWEVQVVPAKGGPTREVHIDACSGEVLEIKAEFDS